MVRLALNDMYWRVSFIFAVVPMATPSVAPSLSPSELLVQKEKPPLNLVGDVHGRIAIIIVRNSL